MQSLTDFGDQAVILPLFVLAAMAFIATGWGRAALVWVLVVPGTLLIVSFGKLYGVACGDNLPDSWDLHSPSGHTASAALVCGGLAGLLLPIRRRMVMAMLSAVVSSTLIGCSRLSLQQHTLTDVVAGAAIGIAGTYVLVHQAGERPSRLRHLPAIGAVLAAGALTFHGIHIPVESWLRDNALALWPLELCRL